MTLTKTERTKILRRVNRQSATIGAQTPETITVHGDTLELQEFIIETRKIDVIPLAAQETLSAAIDVLRDERLERIDQLKNSPLDTETAETIADEIIGIDRALNALTTIRRPSFGDEARSSSVDDHKRWLGFLETVRL